MSNIAAYLLSLLTCTGSEITRKPIDLEEHTNDFVIETKQIVVPGFAGAFNASIIEWGDSILLCFRVRNEKMVSTFQMGCILLDKELNIINAPTLLEMRGHNPSTFGQNQDPRLIVIENKLYMLYSNFIDLGGIVTRRMFITQLLNENGKFVTSDQLCIHCPTRLSPRWEKNWVPFMYNDELLLAYSLLPHYILKPSLQTGECESISSTYSLINWNWGDLRGGTPAVRDGDHYLAFFHSSKLMQTVHSSDKKIQHYFMGAYLFSAYPPFQITHMSPEPIVSQGFYHGQSYNTWKPLHVVFPMGCILDDPYIWVSYGRQDFEIWIAKIDKEKLYASLVPCMLDPNQAPRQKPKNQKTVKGNHEKNAPIMDRLASCMCHTDIFSS